MLRTPVDSELIDSRLGIDQLGLICPDDDSPASRHAVGFRASRDDAGDLYHLW